MLTCATHQTPTQRGQARIPSSLVDLYVQYKQDTRAVVAWLLSHGSERYQRLCTLSIKELARLAEIVQMKSVEMPDTIDFRFRQAIAARSQLSQYFRRATRPGTEDLDTVNHEYFTTSLTKIYTDLCACCAKPKDRCARTNRNRPNLDHIATLHNRFTPLALDTSSHDSPSTNGRQNSRREISTGGQETRTPLSNFPLPRLADDMLAEAFELRKDIQEMEDLMLATTDVWEQTARGEVPLIVATFITHAASAVFEEIENRLQTSCDVTDPEGLQSKFVQMKHNLALSTDEEGDSKSSAARMIEALQEPWHHLLRMRNDGPACTCKETSTCKQPEQLVLRRGSNSTPADDECLTVMLRNIGLHIQASHLYINIIRLGSPVYPEVGYYLTHDEKADNGLRCAYGIRLLLDSYKSYYFALPQPMAASSNCRVQALRFAQEALPSIKAVLEDSTMPCRCRGTLAYHLESLQLDFEAYLKVNVFDFFFQSPWVSGSHILEMLEALFCCGLRLFSYRAYVSSVAHVYNILRQFTDCPLIPILEHLCHAFSGIIYPGGRPSRNFRACYMRSIGGRLRFDPCASQHKSGCHSLAIPAHAARATAGIRLQNDPDDPRFDYQKTSILHHIKKGGYHLDECTWDRICNLSNGITDDSHSPKTRRKNRTCTNHEHSKQDFSFCSPQHRLRSLQKALLTEFTGPFPIAKVNLFQVYLTCIRIIGFISDRYHGDEARRGQNCLCFVEDLLSAADRCRENEYRLQPFGCAELIRICREVMSEIEGGKGLEGFLWKGL